MDRLNKIMNDSLRQKRRKKTPNQIRLRELQTMPYAEYLLTPEWQEKRKEALQRAEYKCQVCNASERLHTHHRTYERRGRELPSDLTVLCETCHSLYHRIGDAQEQSQPTISLEMGLDAYAGIEFSVFNFRVPGVHATYTMALNYVDDHKEQWLVIVGGNGTGKTHLAVAIAHKCIENGENVRFISALDLLDMFDSASKHPTLQAQLIEILHTTDLLVLDNLGAHNTKHKQIKALADMLDYRFKKKLSVVITTQREWLDKIDAHTMRILSDRFYGPFVAQITVSELVYAQSYQGKIRRTN